MKTIVIPEEYESRTVVDFFNQLPELVQNDLIEWFNCEPDFSDKQRLCRLYTTGRFSAWDCPECDHRVFYAEPTDWRYFQGVCQADYTSYPGNDQKYEREYLRAMCDNCRCWG